MASRSITLFESAARVAAAYNSEDQSTSFAKGVIILLSITAITAGTLDLKVQAKDTLTGEYIDLPGAALAAQAAAGVDILTIYPGIAETANVSVSDRLPPFWRVVTTITTGPATYSVFATAVD
jgi:hypothetical protein